MAKRLAEESVRLTSPSKRRHFPPLCRVDMQLESMFPALGASPPSLLTLLGSRCRKRPRYFDNEEAEMSTKTSLLDSERHAKDGLNERSSGSFQDERMSCALSRKKRARKDNVTSDRITLTRRENTTENSSDEDDSFNSFQYWRVPLPELDLSLLEDASDRSQSKDKPRDNDTTTDAMET